MQKQFERYVVSHYGAPLWEGVASECGSAAFAPHDSYLISLIEKTVEKIDKSIYEILEGFGAYISKVIMTICSPYIEPNWKTLDVLEHSNILLSFVMKKYVSDDADLPRLRVRRVSDNKLEAIYISNFVFAHLGRGIVKGIASYYNEEQDLQINLNIKKSGSTFIQIKQKKVV